MTQALYAAVTGKHPWRDKPNGTSWEAGECYHYGEMAQGDSQPAYCVTWTEAVKFCNKLSHLEGLKPAYITMGRTVEPVTGASGYRLPTEAEWEYAARAGERYLYAGSDRASDVGWFYHSKTGSITHPVASKAANAWGIYDMSGNVWEWTGDWKAPYPTGSVTDPQGHPAGVYRVLRGGGFMTPATDGSTAARDGAFPVGADVYRGFRVVRPE